MISLWLSEAGSEHWDTLTRSDRIKFARVFTSVHIYIYYIHIICKCTSYTINNKICTVCHCCIFDTSWDCCNSAAFCDFDLIISGYNLQCDLVRGWGMVIGLGKHHSHRIHVWYIYANIWGILMVNVTIYYIADYSSTMDPMGLDCSMGFQTSSDTNLTRNLTICQTPSSDPRNHWDVQ